LAILKPRDWVVKLQWQQLCLLSYNICRTFTARHRIVQSPGSSIAHYFSEFVG